LDCQPFVERKFNNFNFVTLTIASLVNRLAKNNNNYKLLYLMDLIQYNILEKPISL